MYCISLGRYIIHTIFGNIPKKNPEANVLEWLTLPLTCTIFWFDRILVLEKKVLLFMFLFVWLFFEVFVLFWWGFCFAYEITNIVIIMISKHFTIGHGKRSMFLF